MPRKSAHLVLLGSALVFCLFPGAATRAAVIDGQAAFGLCAACHGAQGEGNVSVHAPSLAGLEPWYLRRQLAAFRAGLRGTAPGDIQGMQMRPMALAISDPDAEAGLIAYIATLPEPDPDPEPSGAGDRVAGKAAYAPCAACHGDRAEGNEALGAPGLAGRSAWYLVRQLKNFRGGLRGYDAADTYGMQMKPMAATLGSDQAMVDVAAYASSLR